MKNITFLFLILFSLNLTAQNNYFKNTAEVKSNNIDSLINSCINEINQDSIKNTIQSLQNYTTRFMLDTNRKTIALSLKEKFISMGYLNTVIDSFLTITNLNHLYYQIKDTTWQYNIIATLEGTQYPDSICIAGGHYDSFSDSLLVGKAPGADDDASGVSATIEIARVFKKMNYQPKLTIKFIAFAAEELMFFSNESGASFYAKKADTNNEKIKFFANNDMIAYNTSLNNWNANFHCFYGMDWMKNFATSICQNYTIITPIILNDNCGGDSYRFWQQGFQALHFEEYKFNPNYHTVRDVVDSLNMPYCAEMTKITMAMLINGTQLYTGINENESNQINVKIYPNPAIDRITIDYAENENLNLSVYNIVGELVLQKILTNHKNIIDIGSLSKGIHLIKLTNKQGTIQQKLIKE